MSGVTLLQEVSRSQRDQERFELAQQIASATPRPIPEAVIRSWVAMIRRHGQPVAAGLLAGLNGAGESRDRLLLHVAASAN